MSSETYRSESIFRIGCQPFDPADGPEHPMFHVLYNAFTGAVKSDSMII
jgi:hypothetical protein